MAPVGTCGSRQALGLDAQARRLTKMSDHKIDQATVDTAIAAAGDALKEPGVAWITESALFERA